MFLQVALQVSEEHLKKKRKYRKLVFLPKNNQKISIVSLNDGKNFADYIGRAQVSIIIWNKLWFHDETE